MKLENGIDNVDEISKMLSEIKSSLTNIMISESLQSTRSSLKHCLTNIENIFVILRKDCSSSEKLLKPLHAGLSRSMETLNTTKESLSSSKSSSNLTMNPNQPKTNSTDVEDVIESICCDDTASPDDVINMTLSRKDTKRRVKVLRWLKKTLLGNEDMNVVGDVYIKIEGAKYQPIKMWCILRNKQLYCYRDVMNDKIDIVVPLDSCHVVPETNTGPPFTFYVEKNKLKLCTFFTKTAKEREKWIEVLGKGRGSVLLREFCEIDENYENDESGDHEEPEEQEECEGEFGDYEDSEGYLCNKRGSSYQSCNNEVLYSVPFEDEQSGVDEEDNEGYISVVEFKNERQMAKNNPNISSKSDLKNLTEKDNPLQTTPLVTRPTTGESPGKSSPITHSPPGRCKPVPLPKTAAVDKLLDDGYSDGDQPELNQRENNDDIVYQEVSMYQPAVHDSIVGKLTVATPGGPSPQDALHPGMMECCLTATSSLKDSPAEQGMFGQQSGTGMTGCWRPEVNDKKQFLEIDLGEVTNIGAVGIQGRPDHVENGGEFVKSYSLFYSTTKEKWTPYKSHGKTKLFQGNCSPHEESKKIFKHIITARYMRICPESWNNNIALRLALYKEQENNQKLKVNEKKIEKPNNKQIGKQLGSSPCSTLERKKGINKTDISSPISKPTNFEEKEALKAINMTDNVFNMTDNVINMTDNVINVPNETGLNGQSSRIQLRESLLTKEKKDQTAALEGLKKLMNYAKDKMIVVNHSHQTKSEEAVDTEEEYLTIHLQLVKVKKRLIDIESELRELRLFADHVVQKPETKARKPVLTRRPSKEIKVCVDAVSPVVDRKAFNPDGEKPPPRKVMHNVKIFENLQNK